MEPLGPIPEGYTEESWSDFLEDAIEKGAMTDLGGVPVVAVKLEKPLVFIGPILEGELVGLSADEMASMGVVPGDMSEDSDSEHLVIYYHEEPVSDSGSDDAVSASASPDFYGDSGSMLSSRSCVSPYYCQLWNETNGSGLVWPKNAYIQIRSKSASATSDRTGVAHFNGGTGGTYSVDLIFSGSTSYTYVTTTYSYGVFVAGVWVWTVYWPDTWVSAGENAWDDIDVKGDAAVSSNNITIDLFSVAHNGYGTGSSNPSPNIVLDSVGETYDLTPAIDEYRTQSMCGVTHDAVEIAMWDLWQGANIFYPVTGWLGSGFGTYYAPTPWCSEFASWVYREWDYDTFHTTEHIPEMGQPKPFPLVGNWNSIDTHVSEFFVWADAVDRLIYLGDDSNASNNGASAEEWELLAYLVPGLPDHRIDAGDYVAIRQCTTSACAAWGTHSMIVMGWWNGSSPRAGCDVDSIYFDPDRMCNQILTISGNLGSSPGRVQWRGLTVCQRPAMSGGQCVDPPCDIDGDSVVDPEDICGIRLWDTHVYNGNPEGDFFARMP